MKTTNIIAAALACLLAGCAPKAPPEPQKPAQISANPQNDIIGVWELQRVFDLDPHALGFVTNLKLVFRPDGKMEKVSGKDAVTGELRYEYKFEGDTKMLTRWKQTAFKSNSVQIRDGALLLREDADGSILYFKKVSTDTANVPVWDEVSVPCAPRETAKTLVPDLAQDYKDAIARLPAMPLDSIKEIPEGRLLGFSDEPEALLVFGTDGEVTYMSRMEDSTPRAQAITLLKAKLGRP